MTLIFRHCQCPGFRFTIMMTTTVTCVLVSRRAVCKVLYSSCPFNSPQGTGNMEGAHILVPLTVVAEYSKSPCNLPPIFNQEARVSFAHIGQ